MKLMDRELASLSVMPRDWRDNWFRAGSCAGLQCHARFQYMLCLNQVEITATCHASYSSEPSRLRPICQASVQLATQLAVRPASSAPGAGDIRQLILALEHIVEEDEHRGVEEVRPARQNRGASCKVRDRSITPVPPVSLLQAVQRPAHLTLLWSPRNVMKFLSPA